MKWKLANGVGSQYLHTTSKHGVFSITTADAHTSAASSRLNWHPCWFKWTRPFCRKKNSDFWACAIICQTQSTHQVQGGSNMTGTVYTCLHTNKSRSYLNHLVLLYQWCTVMQISNLQNRSLLSIQFFSFYTRNSAKLLSIVLQMRPIDRHYVQTLCCTQSVQTAR